MDKRSKATLNFGVAGGEGGVEVTFERQREEVLRQGRGAPGVGSKVSGGRVCGTSSEGSGSERGAASGFRAVSHASAICLV